MDSNLVSVYTGRVKVLRFMNDIERIALRFMLMAPLLCRTWHDAFDKWVVLGVGVLCAAWFLSQVIRNREIDLVERAIATCNSDSEDAYIAIENKISYYGRVGVLKTVLSSEPMVWMIFYAFLSFI